MNDLEVRQCDISKYYNMSQSTVSNIMRKFRQPVEPEKRRSGQLLTPRAKSSFVKVADELRFESSDTVTKHYNKFSPVPVSSRMSLAERNRMLLGRF